MSDTLPPIHPAPVHLSERIQRCTQTLLRNIRELLHHLITGEGEEEEEERSEEEEEEEVKKKKKREVKKKKKKRKKGGTTIRSAIIWAARGACGAVFL